MGSARFGFLPVLAVLILASTATAAPKIAEQHQTKEGDEYFEKKIRPILVKHCYECHSGDAKKAKGNFVLDTREGLRKGGQSGTVIALGNSGVGNPEESLLIEAVRYQGLEMPPKEQL